MKQNEIAVILYTVRNCCQTEKDPFTSLEISYNNLLKFIS